MTFQSLLLVSGLGIAGALGAVARYLLGRFVAKHTRFSFPFGTMLINVSGAFFIGLIFTLSAQHVLSPQSQLVLATGFLGGFTTFSTMSWEGIQLARTGAIVLSVLYFGGSFVLGLGAEFLGMVVGRVL